MRLRLTVVVCFLFALSVAATAQDKPSPTPGKSENDSPKSNTSKKNSKAEQKPSEAPSPITRRQSFDTGDKATSQAEPDKQETAINVTSIPRLSVEPVKDWADWTLWGATIILFVFGAYQIRLLRKSTDAANVSAEAATESAHISQTSLEVAQRAYLAVGKPELILGGDGLIIPINNYGHIPSKGLSGRLNYIRIKIPPEEAGFTVIEQIGIDVNYTEPITPGGGSGFALIVTLPKLPNEESAAIQSGRRAITIAGKLQYDTGFNAKDTLIVGLTYRKDAWSVSFGAGTEIDFRAAQEQQK